MGLWGVVQVGVRLNTSRVTGLHVSQVVSKWDAQIECPSLQGWESIFGMYWLYQVLICEPLWGAHLAFLG